VGWRIALLVSVSVYEADWQTVAFWWGKSNRRADRPGKM